jgi:hypothetical protein
MDPGLQQLLHGDIRHGFFLLVKPPLRLALFTAATGAGLGLADPAGAGQHQFL